MKARLCFAFFLPVFVFAQTQPTNKDFAFVKQLVEEKRNDEALFILHNDKDVVGPDTLNYLLGFVHYLQKRTDSAAHYLGMVPATSRVYIPSAFLRALNLSYNKNVAESIEGLRQLSLDSSGYYIQLYLLTQAGNYLLLRDFKKFDSLSAGFLYDNYNYSSEQKQLVSTKNKLLSKKKKSPVLAGLMSAVVPGLGKFYAGKKGAGLATFMTNVVLAGVVYENYYRGGLESAQFIAFGTLFSFFYAGNIVGSVYSVKQFNRSFQGKINNEILGSIHSSVSRLLYQ